MAAEPTSPDIELSTPTLLKVLLRQQHKQRYETFCLEFERAAEQVATDAPPPSKAQFHRWLSGHLKGGVPYPDACRVLEAMFPPWSAVDLCRPYDPDRYLAANDSRPAPGNLLQSVPSSFPAGALEGDWVTCFKFRHHNDSTWLCHADIVHISAESDRQVAATNYPPIPRTEDRAAGFLTTIDALIVNRHLVGHWRNSNDTRYFGTLQLAVMPGEMVMEGHYTGIASDVEVSFGPWKWVRLEEPPPAENLDDIVLREPKEIDALLATHSQFAGPLQLVAVKEH